VDHGHPLGIRQAGAHRAAELVVGGALPNIDGAIPLVVDGHDEQASIPRGGLQRLPGVRVGVDVGHRRPPLVVVEGGVEEIRIPAIEPRRAAAGAAAVDGLLEEGDLVGGERPSVRAMLAKKSRRVLFCWRKARALAGSRDGGWIAESRRPASSASWRTLAKNCGYGST
jgi:hypothetical protein